MKPHRKSPLHQWQQRAKNPGPGDRCAKCGQSHHLSVDHVVPVSWVQQFIPLPDGEDVGLSDPAAWWEENFQLLCLYCNRFKGNSIDPRDPRVYEVLEKLIAKARRDHLPASPESLA